MRVGTRVMVLSAVLVGLCQPPAFASMLASRCDEDGVTETPGFATRGGDECLYIDPGNGDAPVRFQWEVFHKTGIMESALDSGENPGVDIMDLRRKSVCEDNETCSFLMWDSVVDNYSTSAAKNDDVMFFGTGQRNEYTLIKDSIIANGVKCAGGRGWDGPNGLKCRSGEDSNAHSDGMQIRGQPVNDGWFVIQDTLFVNGFNLQLLNQVDSQKGRTGSFVIQGGEVGRRKGVGEAADWVADCEARSDNGSNGADICPEGRAQIGNNTREVWFIDVDGETEINPKGNHEKVVIVKPPRFNRGWPHPLQGISTEGPGDCPNGRLSESFQGNPTYCYESLEWASDDHKLPPFVHLSASGWAEPPPDVTLPPDPGPDPDPEPDPEPVVGPAVLAARLVEVTVDLEGEPTANQVVDDSIEDGDVIDVAGRLLAVEYLTPASCGDLEMEKTGASKFRESSVPFCSAGDRQICRADHALSAFEGEMTLSAQCQGTEDVPGPVFERVVTVVQPAPPEPPPAEPGFYRLELWCDPATGVCAPVAP